MDGKKISFGFKSIQKPNIINSLKQVKPQIDKEIIEFVEGQSIKIMG